MEVLISIIMPVRNGLPFLNHCIESIQNQSYNRWELIVVDDNSIDQTWESLTDFAAKDSRIVPLKSTGTGILDALNLGATKSAGTLITRMDADDIMELNKLELMAKDCEKETIVIGLVNYFSETTIGEGFKKYADWLNTLTSKGANYDDIYKECTVPSACWMMNRSDFERCGGFGSRYPEDYDLAFRIRSAKLQIVPIKKVLHQWRDHSKRASRNDPNYLDNRFIDLKVDYFLSDDHNPTLHLTLVGAGKKGKLIAKKLLDKEIEFDWATNNLRKIGVNIFGKHLIDENKINKTDQLIVAVAGTDGMALRAAYLDGYFFC